MGDIRDRILERKAMEDMEENAQITELSVGVDFLLSIVGQYGGSSTPPHYSRKSTHWEIDEKTAEELIDMDDREDWINDNKAEYENLSFAHYKDVKSTIYLEAKIVCEFEYFNGGTLTGTRKIKLDTANCYSPIIDVGCNGNVKIVGESEDELVIEASDERVSYRKRKENVTEHELSGIMKEYLTVESSTIEGQFSVEELEEYLSIGIQSGSSEYEIRFEPPFNDDSKVWELSQAFDYEGPFSLDRNSCKVSFNGVVDDSWCRLGYIRVDKENKNVNIIRRLKDRMSNFASEISEES